MTPGQAIHMHNFPYSRFRLGGGGNFLRCCINVIYNCLHSHNFMFFFHLILLFLLNKKKEVYAWEIPQ